MRSKRILKRLIPLFTILIGATLVAVGFSIGAKEAYFTNLNLTNIDSVVESSGIAGIDVNVSIADLEIIASNDVKDFMISAQNISRSNLRYTVSDHILSLKYVNEKWYKAVEIPGLMRKDGKIKITVPADLPIKDIQIKSGIGKSSVKYLTAENVYINCGLGSNSFESIKANYIEIENNMGDIFAKDMNAKKIYVSCGDGQSDFQNIYSESAVIKNGMGDMTLSGAIEGDSRFECGLGDINAELYGCKDDYSIYAISGDIRINGRKAVQTTGGKYNMDVVGGDISLDFKQ